MIAGQGCLLLLLMLIKTLCLWGVFLYIFVLSHSYYYLVPVTHINYRLTCYGKGRPLRIQITLTTSNYQHQHIYYHALRSSTYISLEETLFISSSPLSVGGSCLSFKTYLQSAHYAMTTSQSQSSGPARIDATVNRIIWMACSSWGSIEYIGRYTGFESMRWLC